MARELMEDARSVAFWDSYQFGEDGTGRPYSRLLFGNANIGNANLCNLQIAGMFHSRCTILIQRWYARTNLQGEALDALQQCAHECTATLNMGEMPQWNTNLSDLMARRPVYGNSKQPSMVFDPWPLVLPIRQNVSARLDFFGPTWEHHAATLRGGRVWVHAEGVQLYRDSALVIDRLTCRRPAAQRIVDYVIGLANECADGSPEQAQLHAVADGIMERS